jgi:hypothetical protein
VEKKQTRFSEIRLPLELSRSELVRAFVREAALLEGALPSIATQIAEDSLRAWAVLCALANGSDNASLIVSSWRRDVHCRILVKGHARFSRLAQSLGDLVRPDAGFSIRERGIDGWELSFHRKIAEEVEQLERFDLAIPQEAATAASAEVRIDLPSRKDAAAIARCFLDVYGHNYVHTEVFSPQRYWSKVEDGALIPVVARNEKDEVIGHVALEREPGAIIAERGEAVVVNAYRGRHLLEQMTERLSEEAQKLGLTGIYALPVTIHTFSQRNDERAGMPVCAVLLGAAPETSHPKDANYPTHGQRQSYLMTFRFLKEPPERRIYAPEPYRAVMLRIYESLGAKAAASQSGAPAAENSKTKVSIDTRGYGKIHFEQVGAKAGIELNQAFQDILGLGARAVQLSAPVDDPGLPLLAEEARKRGFFFCGVGPAFFDDRDILMLQFLSDPLDLDKLQLYTDRARELVSFIKGDRPAIH